jgi:hypothetical protein
MAELRQAARKRPKARDDDDARAAARKALYRDHARRHPPPGLDRLTLEERREKLGDAYMG